MTERITVTPGEGDNVECAITVGDRTYTLVGLPEVELTRPAPDMIDIGFGDGRVYGAMPDWQITLTVKGRTLHMKDGR